MNFKILAIMLIAEIVHYGTSIEYVQKTFPVPPGSCMTIDCHKPPQDGVDLECVKKYIKNGKPDGYSFFLKKDGNQYLLVTETGEPTGATSTIEKFDFITKYTRIDHNGKTTDICCATDKRKLNYLMWMQVNGFCYEEYKKNDQNNCTTSN